jgi:hypothetical protein
MSRLIEAMPSISSAVIAVIGPLDVSRRVRVPVTVMLWPASATGARSIGSEAARLR